MNQDFEGNDLPDTGLDDVSGSEAPPEEGYEGEDTEMGNALDGLFGLQQKVQKDLPAVPLVAVASTPVAIEQPGDFIGRYKLIQRIGEGGMGIVWMAVQFEPVQRRVALKVIKVGMDTREVVSRFEAERQALALMQHPNIAQVLDGGATDSGRPYFVMEMVEGIPVTEYCNKATLSTRERLLLFMQVCEAIQHAHQKGIIHRDIKPSNVLVTNQDGKALPKVIDFGIAKATSQKLTERTLFTQFGQMVGTPAYMSPEQAELTAEDIDTRSDIYSLGVLLYELLTGSTPFEDTRLRQVAIDELCRIIREVEPPKPSARLSTLGRQLLVVAQQRHSDARRLPRILRGELDWIVMRALEKDRSRRYQTATAFGDDVERFLVNKAVEASPPSVLYRVSKFARRHSAGVTATAIAIVALVTASAVSTVMAIRESAAKQAVIKERNAAMESAQIARTAVKEMLAEVGDRSLKHIPRMEKVRERLLARAVALNQALLEIDSDGPELRREAANAHDSLADIYMLLGNESRSLDESQAALAMFRALAHDFPNPPEYEEDLASTLLAMGRRLNAAKDLEESESVLGEAVRRYGKLIDDEPENHDLLTAAAHAHMELGVLLSNWERLEDAEKAGEAALDLMERAGKVSSPSPGDRDLIASMRANLAGVLIQQGRAGDAERHLNAAIQTLVILTGEHPENSDYLDHLVSAYQNLIAVKRQSKNGKSDLVELYAEIAKHLSKLIDQFPDTPHFRATLGGLHMEMSFFFMNAGDDSNAASTAKKATDAFAKLSDDYPEIDGFENGLAQAMTNQGTLLLNKGQLPEAHRSFVAARDILEDLVKRESDVPDYRQRLARVWHNLGLTLTQQVIGRQGDHAALDAEIDSELTEEADGATREAIRLLGELVRKHPNTADYQIDLAMAYNQIGVIFSVLSNVQKEENRIKAETSYAQAVALLKTLTDKHENLARALSELGFSQVNLVFVRMLAPDVNEDVKRECLAICDEALKNVREAASMDPNQIHKRRIQLIEARKVELMKEQ